MLTRSLSNNSDDFSWGLYASKTIGSLRLNLTGLPLLNKDGSKVVLSRPAKGGQMSFAHREG